MRTVEIITAECVYGMNFFRDFFAGMSDTLGGRSETTQRALRDARETVLAGAAARGGPRRRQRRDRR